MANEEHVAILKQGVKVWNKWREEYPEVMPVLDGVELCAVDLSEIDLSEVNLSQAKLVSSIFYSSQLYGADLRYADLSYTEFTGANLIETDLRFANLSYASLSGAKLFRADLTNVDLSYSDLTYADLTEADLSNTNLVEANLSQANLNQTNFYWANLTGVNFTQADLRETDFTGASTSRTIFGDVDLSFSKRLDTIRHRGPSIVGIDTAYNSKGHIPEVFLRGAGVPDNFITYVKSLTGAAFEFYSCFISHSSKDQVFVERLYADLQAKGVRCWYAPEDLKIGEPFLLGIDQGIRLHDKLLLVLSEDSVASGWVQHEVLSALAKEQGKAPWVLFPIRVDDTIMNTSVSWATMIKQSRHIGNFTLWKDHDAYQQAFERLLRDLKA